MCSSNGAKNNKDSASISNKGEKNENTDSPNKVNQEELKKTLETKFCDCLSFDNSKKSKTNFWVKFDSCRQIVSSELKNYELDKEFVLNYSCSDKLSVYKKEIEKQIKKILTGNTWIKREDMDKQSLKLYSWDFTKNEVSVLNCKNGIKFILSTDTIKFNNEKQKFALIKINEEDSKVILKFNDKEIEYLPVDNNYKIIGTWTVNDWIDGDTFYYTFYSNNTYDLRRKGVKNVKLTGKYTLLKNNRIEVIDDETQEGQVSKINFISNDHAVFTSLMNGASINLYRNYEDNCNEGDLLNE